MGSFYTQLQDLRRSLRRRLLTALTAAVLAALGLIAMTAEGLNRLQPWQESTALGFFALLLLVALVAFTGTGAYLWRTHRSLRHLVDRIEDHHPELMDSLHCAIELKEREAFHPNPIETALLEQVNASARRIDFRAAVVPPWLGNRSLAAFIALGIVLAASATQLPVAQKAAYRLSDIRTGHLSGLWVDPGNTEVARRQDLHIRAEILRWEHVLEIDYAFPDEPVRTDPVFTNAEGSWGFTFYNPSQSFRYRLRTPSLTSPWFDVEVYEPPRIEAFSMTLQPPAYTALPKAILETPGAIEIVEGTRLEVSVETHPDHKVWIEIDGDARAFVGTEAGRHQTGFVATSSVRYRLIVQDEHHRTTETAPFDITVVPDEPPRVEITRPAEDITIAPGARVSIEAFATDDFGVARGDLNVTLAGRDPIVSNLYEATGAPEPDVEFIHRLDLDSLSANDGDVILYYVSVRDNREPASQAARSDIYFIEVRADMEPEETEGMDGETQEVDVRALIIEIKRIIRDTYRALALPEGRDRVHTNQELSIALSRVRLEIWELWRELQALLGGTDPNGILAYLERANTQLENAESLLSRHRPEEAIPPEVAGLRELVAFENELRSQQISKDSKGSGEGESEESSEPSGSKEPSAEEPPRFAELPPLLEDLNVLIDNQSALNQSMGRSSRSGAPTAHNEGLAAEQRDLEARNRDIATQLERLAQAAPLGQLLNQAAHHMGEASSSLGENDPSRGERYGIRAGEALVNAAALLEGLINETAAAMMLDLAQQTEALGSQQAAAASQSGEAASGNRPSEGLEAAQTELNNAFNQLRQDFARVGQELRQQFPETTRQLEDVTRDLERARTDATMTRAGNALLYERFQRAEELQTQAAGDLSAAANDLREAGAEIPMLNDAAVRRALAELERGRGELSELAAGDSNGDPSQQPSGEQLASLRERLSAMLGETAGRLDDTLLREMSAQLAEPGAASSWAGILGETGRTLDQATHALLRHLQKASSDQVRDRARREAPPRYQRQVDEYFRRLSEEDRQP